MRSISSVERSLGAGSAGTLDIRSLRTYTTNSLTELKPDGSMMDFILSYS